MRQYFCRLDHIVSLRPAVGHKEKHSHALDMTFASCLPLTPQIASSAFPPTPQLASSPPPHSTTFLPLTRHATFPSFVSSHLGGLARSQSQTFCDLAPACLVNFLLLIHNPPFLHLSPINSHRCGLSRPESQSLSFRRVTAARIRHGCHADLPRSCGRLHWVSLHESI